MNKKNKVSKKKQSRKITQGMTFGEAISLDKNVAKVLAENHMFCGCCPMAMMETIEQGAAAHQVDLKKLMKELNKE